MGSQEVINMTLDVFQNSHRFPVQMRYALIIGLVLGYILYFLFPSPVLRERQVFQAVEGSNVLITGASKGIGEELAYSYSKRGANLLITARSEDLLAKVAKKCRALGAGSVYLFAADMSQPSHIQALFEFTKSKFRSRLDFLVLNHAKQHTADDWSGSDQNMTVLNDIMNVNFFAYVQLSSLFMSTLEKSSGRLIVVSSFVGKVAFPYFISYVSSKHALQGFFGGLNHELKLRNSKISTTLAVLGRIDTPGQREGMGTGKFIRHKNSAPAAPASDCAEAIIHGTVRKQKEVYFPSWIRPLTFLPNIPVLTDFLDFMVRFQMERESAE